MTFETSRYATQYDFYLNNVKLEVVTVYVFQVPRYLLFKKVRKSTNLSGLYGELGRYPLLVYRKISMSRYWIKLLSSSDTFIPKRMI